MDLVYPHFFRGFGEQSHEPTKGGETDIFKAQLHARSASFPLGAIECQWATHNCLLQKPTKELLI